MSTIANESYPLNLLNAVAKGHWEYSLPEDIEQSLAYVLAGLTEQEQEIIYAYFHERLTYKEIALTQKVTIGRIQNIVAKSVDKLSHPTRMQFLIHGVKGVIQKTSVEAAQKAISIRLEQALLDVDKIAQYLHTITCKEECLNISPKCEEPSWAVRLDELDLSCRSYNCLKRAGVTTILDITKMSKDDLMHVKNMGRKSFEEVVNIVHNRGLKLADE